MYIQPLSGANSFRFGGHLWSGSVGPPFAVIGPICSPDCRWSESKEALDLLTHHCFIASSVRNQEVTAEKEEAKHFA